MFDFLDRLHLNCELALPLPPDVDRFLDRDHTPVGEHDFLERLLECGKVYVEGFTGAYFLAAAIWARVGLHVGLEGGLFLLPPPLTGLNCNKDHPKYAQERKENAHYHTSCRGCLSTVRMPGGPTERNSSVNTGHVSIGTPTPSLEHLIPLVVHHEPPNARVGEYDHLRGSHLWITSPRHKLELLVRHAAPHDPHERSAQRLKAQVELLLTKWVLTG
ncbi:cystatin/monellin superfamily protein [Striga asiatica]|uniref:Cystatin/monellin superfamily protein n=1 Tax=Striga asiatica TaxID=4170 RepID=A0A5A7PRZ9_STRAF|nr:cystatin/monellin superfamily protein [Striga asiatica]